MERQELLVEHVHSAGIHVTNEADASKYATFSLRLSTAPGSCITSLGDAWLAALFFSEASVSPKVN